MASVTTNRAARRTRALPTLASAIVCLQGAVATAHPDTINGKSGTNPGRREIGPNTQDTMRISSGCQRERVVGPQPAVRWVTNPGKTQLEAIEAVTERRDLVTVRTNTTRARGVPFVRPRALCNRPSDRHRYLLVMPLF